MEDFNDNFKNGSDNNYCRLCYKFESKSVQYQDSQKHFLNCNVMMREEPTINELVEEKSIQLRKLITSMSRFCLRRKKSGLNFLKLKPI